MPRIRLSLLLALALTACGGGNRVEDLMGVGDVLGAEEAEALATLLVGQSMESGLAGLYGPPQAPPRVPSKAPFTVDDRVAGEVPCLRGGSYFFSGTLVGSGDAELGEMDLSFALVQAHSECSVVHEETGLEFTLDGDPQLAFEYDLMITNQTNLDLLGTIVGGVLWATEDGRDGSCRIDLGFEMSADGATGALSVTAEGEVCGVQVSQTVTQG